MGCEPMNFTCHFHAWDDDKWRAGKTYDEMKAEMNANGAEGSAVVDGPVEDEGEHDHGHDHGDPMGGMGGMGGMPGMGGGMPGMGGMGF